MENRNLPSFLELVWHQGYFKVERTFNDILNHLSTIGCNPSPQNLNNAIKHAKFLTKRGKEGKRRYIQKHSASGLPSAQGILPPELVKVLTKDFKTELVDLNHNFGVSGTCSAFMIRKILEKLLVIAFNKHGQASQLIDSSTGKQIGLQATISKATTIRIGGKPILTKHTADRIAPIKFLGDTAAHNPLINVSMQVIEKEMAYVVVAYSELSEWI